jgi:hypothetical protein
MANRCPRCMVQRGLRPTRPTASVEVDGILVAGDRQNTDITISNIACRIRPGSRRSGIASASRRQTPCLRSASRRSSTPPSDDWLPPANRRWSYLHRTDGRSNGSGVSSGHSGCDAGLIREATGGRGPRCLFRGHRFLVDHIHAVARRLPHPRGRPGKARFVHFDLRTREGSVRALRFARGRNLAASGPLLSTSSCDCEGTGLGRSPSFCLSSESYFSC